MENQAPGEQIVGDSPTLPPGFSGVCDSCGGPNDKSENLYQCAPCFNAWFGKPAHTPTMISTVYVGRGMVKATVGHIKDIKSRRVAEDGRGTVREKPKRIYLTGGNYGV